VRILIPPDKIYMGVSTNGESPKWLVYSMENSQLKIDHLGVPPFQETSKYLFFPVDRW
jgi:hypothetical protein